MRKPDQQAIALLTGLLADEIVMLATPRARFRRPVQRHDSATLDTVELTRERTPALRESRLG